MIDIQSIKIVLARMAELLRGGGVNDWALALNEFESKIEDFPHATTARILSTFGGSGSLNDLVIYKNGQPIISENGELDKLRSKLYGLCHD